MPKPDFFQIPVPSLPKETRTIDVDGQSLTIELKSLDLTERHCVVDLTFDLMSRFMGDEENAPTDELPARRSATGEMVKVKMSRNLCGLVARIFIQQTAKEPDNLRIEELFMASLTWPSGFEKLIEFSSDMQAKVTKKKAKDDDSGNASPESTEG